MQEIDRAVIFQGQGEQYAGMGKEIYGRFPSARKVYELASDTLGMDMKKLCFKDPDNNLGQARFAQPAITAVNLASYAAYREKFGEPGHVAGHSLGEYSAAAASGAISFEDAFRIVDARGKLMDEVGAKQPGAMAVCLGPTIDKIKEICARVGVEIANDNAEGQTVISGLKSRIDSVPDIIKEYKGKVRLLPIFVASHCSIMLPARQELESMLARIKIEIDEKYIPFVSGVTADYVLRADDFRKYLAEQMTTTVRWRETVQTLFDHGAEEFDEAGPRKVLTKIVLRINPNAQARHIDEMLLEAA